MLSPNKLALRVAWPINAVATDLTDAAIDLTNSAPAQLIETASADLTQAAAADWRRIPTTLRMQ
jgi:hypothetical protein